MIAIWVPSRKASSTSCVTNRIVLRTPRWMRSNSACMRPRVIASRAPNGSSIRRMAGSVASALARPTRCCSPPESCRGYRRRYSRGSRPTSVSSSSARPAIRSFAHPATSPVTRMFSAAVMCGKRPTCWMTYPMLRRRAMGSSSSTFLPSIMMEPLVGSMSRLTMRRSVVFPEPDVPRSMQMMPGGTSNVTPSTAGLAVPGYLLVTSRKAILLMSPPVHSTPPARTPPRLPAIPPTTGEAAGGSSRPGPGAPGRSPGSGSGTRPGCRR